ncbi:armadillo repeat-containing protein 7 isoform X2 [Petromyzon marinus]|uniref:armadillo repeat-containing protein 7 isoform X2 n=1 Tax=Petromyzon marinus TaxID=7757 RepID=UPI003F714571
MQGSWDVNGGGGRKRSDPCGPERLAFLQALVSEYQDSTDEGACDQVLANLANFASDPTQAPFLLALQVPALFSDAATSSRERTAEFGMGGLCNLSADPRCRDAIEAAGGVEAAVRCLSRASEETVLSAITALVLLHQHRHQRQQRGPWAALPVVQCMLRLQQAESARLRTLATLFLQDCCSPAQVEEAHKTESQSAVGIPLPPGPPPTTDLSSGRGP